jgi:hypothetical protein
MLEIMDQFKNGYPITILEDRKEEEITQCMMSVIVEWGRRN